jgi:poly-gamma-glutamate capsule biosynthesis protein CapA/YwtB (metallophosphatase superfamily)
VLTAVAVLATTTVYAATGPADWGDPPSGEAITDSPPAAPTPAVSKPAPRTFTLAFTGDVLSHQAVTRQAAANAARVGGRGYDYRPMFAAVRPLISAADLAICHLETPLSRDNANLGGFPLFNVPFELAAALADAGYDGCSTASNHALDARADGVAATLEHLDRVQIGHAGTARSPEEAATPRLYRVQGVTVGHLSYTYGLNGIPLPPEQPWLVNLIDANRILADAGAARAAGAEFVVVSLHWGVEYRSSPTPEQSALAHQLLASPDIDLIVGHHAHVVQPVERIGAEYVVYGLGNFLSNQSAACCTAAAQDGIIIEARVTEGTKRNAFTVETLTFTPTRVDRSDFRIVPVALALDDPNLDSTLRAELGASWHRTTQVVTVLAAPGLTPSAAPGQRQRARWSKRSA